MNELLKLSLHNLLQSMVYTFDSAHSMINMQGDYVFVVGLMYRAVEELAHRPQLFNG